MKKIYMKCFGILFFLFQAFFGFSQSTSTFTSTSTWTCPPGVTSVQVEAWGGGGAGGGVNTTTSAAAGGGGGGAYTLAASVPVVSGTVYTVTVGSGGTAVSSAAGGAGGSSWFSTAGTILAVGGAGGAASTTTTPAAGAAAVTTGNVGGATNYYGGAGGTGATNATSGGGGSSAGTASNGVDAASGTGGTAVAGGGAGAAGRTNGQAGIAGSAPGGGGGGARSTGTARAGGAGGAGKVVLTYTCSPNALPITEGFNSNATPGCWAQQNVTGSLAIQFVTSTAGTSPVVSAPYEGSRMIFYNSYSNSTSTRLVSLPLNTTGVSSVDVNFQWYLSSLGAPATYPTEGVTVQWSTDGVTWNDFAGNFIHRYSATPGWTSETLTLPAGAGNQPTVYVGFKLTGNSGYDIYMDAVSIIPTPLCTAPTGITVGSITATSGSVSFTSTGSAFILEYGAAGFTPGSGNTPGAGGTIVTGAGSPIAITGLSGSTSYDVYLRNNCTAASTGYSGNSGKATFSTLPANDACSAATPLICGAAAINGTTVGTVSETSPGCGSPYGVWYTFTGNGSIVTVTSPSVFDHSLGIYSGTCGALTAVSCTDNSTITETATFTSVNGVTYYVYVAYYSSTGSASSEGTFSIGITCVSCGAPAAVSSAAVTSSSANITFTGSGTSYIVEYGAAGFTPGTDNTAGVGGTIVTGTGSPIALSGLTPSTSYDVYVRQDCSGAGNGFSTNSTKYVLTTVALPPACTTNIAPVNGATNLGSPVSLSWNAAPTATSYNVMLSYNGGAFASVGNISGTSGVLSLTLPGNYAWYALPVNSGGSPTGCAANATTFSTNPAAPNDLCANATDLIVSNGYCSSPTLSTLAFADSTAGLPAPSCQASYFKYDVWFKATVPATGNLTVQTSAVNTTVIDLLMQAYSGTCGALAVIGCDDDGNPDSGPSNLHPKLGLTARTPGEVIYYRVMAYTSSGSFANLGAFAICAFDTTTSVIPAIATGSPNSCTPAAGINIDSSYKYTWATLKDASGNVIGQVYPNGNILGNTSASFYINSGAVRKDLANKPYLDRNITITPATQPVSGSVTTRLFYTAAELAALQTADPTVTGQSSLNSTKTAQVCGPVVIGPGTYIARNAGGTYSVGGYYLDVLNTSYSTFFIEGGSLVLPISLEYFTGRKQASGNVLDWKVSSTSTSVLTLERSTDKVSFKAINVQTATVDRMLAPFTYTDAAPAAGINYYRLKITNADGESKYSNVVALINKEKGFELISVAPNPVQHSTVLSLSSAKQGKIELSVSDATGKVVMKQSINVIAGNNPVTLNFAALAAGTYQITAVNADGDSKSTRFVKF